MVDGRTGGAALQGRTQISRQRGFAEGGGVHQDVDCFHGDDDRVAVGYAEVRAYGERSVAQASGGDG